MTHRHTPVILCRRRWFRRRYWVRCAGCGERHGPFDRGFARFVQIDMWYMEAR